MGKINILDAESANMIAAGEVVDRPASALKELLENSVDASAKNITVDLGGGGNTRIRVTDDGDGIMREDLPKTVYRHATSKIKNGYEIDGVKTLGFRGEALAAASSVSRMEIISKTRDEEMGNRLTVDETGAELYETGCADGTTVIINDLFYNVPARRKFMKKDSSELTACLAVCEKLALSHPEISLTVKSEGVVKMRTSGDGKLYSAIYAIYDSQNAKTFIPVDHVQDGIRVNGYISRPDSPRSSRNMQTFFVNERYVKSRTAQASLEEAYRSYIPSGKFPAAVLFITLNRNDIDVNVHPAKTEIKFADEKKVFSAIYYAVKGVLSPSDEKTEKAEQNEQNKKENIEKPVSSSSVKTVWKQKDDVTFFDSSQRQAEPPPVYEHKVFSASIADDEVPLLRRNHSPDVVFESPLKIYTPETKKESDKKEDVAEKDEVRTQETFVKDEFRIIGEAYNTYVFAEFADKIMIIDKHAAHERILYERLKDRKTVSVQSLLFPVTVTLSPSEAETILRNAPYLAEYGFTVEEFGPSTVAVREVPSSLKSIDGIAQIIELFAKEITENNTLPFEDKVDKALYTVACKAAVKAHQITGEHDDRYILENILKMDLKYCPHGRPFVKVIAKKEIERYFDR